MDQEQTIKDILETVEFIKDNSTTKQDLSVLEAQIDKQFEQANKRFDDIDSKLDKGKSEVITHVDGLAVLHQKLDSELAALRAKYDRLESHVLVLAKHANVQLDF